MKLIIEGNTEEIRELLDFSNTIDKKRLKDSVIKYGIDIFKNGKKNNSPEMVAAIAELLSKIWLFSRIKSNILDLVTLNRDRNITDYVVCDIWTEG